MATVHIPALSGGARGIPVYSDEIQNYLLYTWYNEVKRTGGSYIVILNNSLANDPIRVKETAIRVDGRLRRRAGEIVTKFHNLSTRKKNSTNKHAHTHITLGENEIVKPAELVTTTFGFNGVNKVNVMFC